MKLFGGIFGGAKDGHAPESSSVGLRNVPVIAAQTTEIAQTSNHSEWSEIFAAGVGSAGVAVNEKTAMRVSTVYACVGLIAGSIASMPLHVYKRTDDGREKVKHDIWWLLNEQPNPCYSAAVFWEYMVSSVLLHGDAFAKILRPNSISPAISGFEALHPLSVEVRKISGRLVYIIHRSEGGVEVLDQDDMLHVPGLGFNGLRGLSVLKNSLALPAGIAIAADEYSAEFFKNGARPDFVLVNKGKLTTEQAEIIRTTWSSRHTGLGNRHLPAILSGELDAKQLTMNAEDAQLIATRGFQIEEICRPFGVQPFMVGHSEKTSSWGTGIEQLSVGFVKYTLLKWMIKFQQEVNRKCFRTATYFCEFNSAALERGDTKSRYEAHRIALGRAGEPGWLSENEVRRIENLPPVEGGDKINTGARSDAQNA